MKKRNDKPNGAAPANVETQVYTKLLEMAQPIKTGERALQKAREKVQGGYDVGMEAAAIAGSWDVFNAAMDRLKAGIRRNDDGLAVKFGAEKREKADKKGNKYKVPASISTVTSRVKKAFEHDVQFRDKDGQVRTYNSVSQEVAKQDELARAEKLTGDDLIRHHVNSACSSLNDRAKKLTGAELAEFATALFALGATWKCDLPQISDLATELESAASESEDKDSGEKEAERQAQAG